MTGSHLSGVLHVAVAAAAEWRTATPGLRSLPLSLPLCPLLTLFDVQRLRRTSTVVWCAVSGARPLQLGGRTCWAVRSIDTLERQGEREDKIYTNPNLVDDKQFHAARCYRFRFMMPSHESEYRVMPASSHRLCSRAYFHWWDRAVAHCSIPINRLSVFINVYRSNDVLLL